jgi:hypothetical protein
LTKRISACLAADMLGEEIKHDRECGKRRIGEEGAFEKWPPNVVR